MAGRRADLGDAAGNQDFPTGPIRRLREDSLEPAAPCYSWGENAPVRTNTRCSQHRVIESLAGARVIGAPNAMDGDQSTPTPGSNTSPSVERSTGAAPALAYTNPQPRLPHSEASAPEQPETFMRRARRVKVGSHRLKLWYLSLCTFGRAWTRGEDVLEIGIKQRTLAGELETRLNVVSRTLAELRATGLVHVLRRKYHSTIRIFLTPQAETDTPQAGVSEADPPGEDTPLLGVSEAAAAPADTLRTGVSDQAGPAPDTPHTGVSEPHATGLDTPQLGVSQNPDTPHVGVADTPQVGVTKVFRSVLDVQQQQHAGARQATEKQLAGIASMATELGITIPVPQDRLAADVVFRELRERVEARRAKRRLRLRTETKSRRHRIVVGLNGGGVCEVCGEQRPDPKGVCPGSGAETPAEQQEVEAKEPREPDMGNPAERRQRIGLLEVAIRDHGARTDPGQLKEWRRELDELRVMDEST